MTGIRNAKQAGIKTGLRFTIYKQNYKEVPKIFDLIEKENIERVCFYHLVYAGRGSNLVTEDLTHKESRQIVDYIMDRTRDSFNKGRQIEVLTVDNHADGPYIYLRLLNENPIRAKEVSELLMMNEGNSSGVGIACIDEKGNVHADQFWRHYSFGNVWKDPSVKSGWIHQMNLWQSLKRKNNLYGGGARPADGSIFAAGISG